jgi:hypothetical protein
MPSRDGESPAPSGDGEIPNPKSQTNSKHQIPNFGREILSLNMEVHSRSEVHARGFEPWSLEFGACLEFGIWNLEFWRRPGGKYLCKANGHPGGP